MGFEDPGLWVAIGSTTTALAATFRPAVNLVIFFLAVHGASAEQKPTIIEALAKTRQFGLWDKPRWPPRRQAQATEKQPADEEA